MLESDRLSMSIASWSAGIAYESDFWANWVSSGGLAWPEEFRQRLDPSMEIDEHFAALLIGKVDPKILDVGAGPLTIVGKVLHGKPLTVEACDPIADLYAHFIATIDQEPPIKTAFANAEDLSVFYDESSFDIVTCRNALDHSFDPVRGIIEMLRVVKLDGSVVLRHFQNEAEKEAYIGFHQYNFDLDGQGDFVIWNKSERVIVKDILPIDAEITSSLMHGQVDIVIKKRSEFPAENASRYRQRSRELITGLIGYYVNQELLRRSML